MPEVHLVLSIPQGVITATSLGIEGLALHRSPGSGKHFRGRKLFVELATSNGRPDFSYLDEGGWRDAAGDTASALAAAQAGKRTKTALSNNAFSCTPIEAYRRIWLVKTGGEVMPLEPGRDLHAFASHSCHEAMSPAQVAVAAGCPDHVRKTHIYLVMCPIQLLLVSNLTPVEYAWYATHRPGKIFRQVVFTELEPERTHLSAQSRLTSALIELDRQPVKKTKTIVSEDCINEVPFFAWSGYESSQDGLFLADREHVSLWPFPGEIPVAWDHVTG
ncbi:MAG TPA: hypothetical protein P5266_05315 [Candidatus Fermentibacter sp.]|nr:hypothetical protein [Candidatus Fermentibacter sp.]